MQHAGTLTAPVKRPPRRPSPSRETLSARTVLTWRFALAGSISTSCGGPAHEGDEPITSRGAGQDLVARGGAVDRGAGVTCDLPDAGINVVKSDASAGDTVNEAVSVQPSDTDALFRQVDCKYIYNLSVSSLTGTGTYRVYANIDGVNVPDPAKFDLK